MEPETEVELLRTVNATHKMVERLNTAVLGDEGAGIPGHGKRIEDSEDHIEKINGKLNRFWGVGAALSFIWGLAVTIVVAFKDKIFS